jgi:hypothetical protein
MRHTRYEDLPFNDMSPVDYRAQIHGPALAMIRENMRVLKENFGIRITGGLDVEGYAIERQPDGSLAPVDMNEFDLKGARQLVSGRFGAEGKQKLLSDLIEEAGDGQYELISRLLPPDEVARLFHAIRSLSNRYAKEFGAEYIDFGDKPFPAGNDSEPERPGSAGHLHIGLRDELGNNLFWHNWSKDPDHPRYTPSPLVQYLARDLLPVLHAATLIFAPSPDSYDRFSRKMSAPSSIIYGSDIDVTTALRLAHGEGPHFEVRYGGASMDPFLAMALLTQALRETIEKNVKVEERARSSAVIDSTLEGSAIGSLGGQVPSLRTMFAKMDALYKALGKPETSPAEIDRTGTYRHIVVPNKPVARMPRFDIPENIETAHEMFRDSRLLQTMLGPLHNAVLDYYERQHALPKQLSTPKDAPWQGQMKERAAKPTLPGLPS